MSRYVFKIACFLQITLIFCCVSTVCAADKEKSKLSISSEEASIASRPPSEPLSFTWPLFDPVEAVDNEFSRFNRSPDLALREDFSLALIALDEQRFADASRALESLAFSRDVRGYHNLPDFSHSLLEIADRFVELGKLDEVRFLVVKATEISPSDGRVLLSAASFYEHIGWGEGASYLWSALSHLLLQPVFFSTILVNILLVLLLSVTTSFFLAAVVQMLRFSSRIHRGLVSILPWSFRGFLAPICLFSLFIVPLYGGLLFAMGTWAVVLACARSSSQTFGARKLFGLCVAIICVCWGTLLPKINTVGYNLRLESTRVFEDINRFGFSPRGEKHIKEQLRNNPEDMVHLFALGLIMKLKGFQEIASQQFETVSRLSGHGTLIHNAAQANLAVMAYDDNDYEKALNIFKRVEHNGGREFELYYNLANTSMLLLQEEEHEKYFAKAKALDESRLDKLIANNSLTPEALSYPAPINLSYSLLLRPIEESDESHAEIVRQGRYEVYDYLLHGANDQIVVVFGLLIVLLVLLLPGFARKKSPELEREMGAASGWSLLPAGAPLAGNQPIWGAFVLCFSLVFLLAGTGSPLQFYGDFSSAISFREEFFLIAAVTFMLTTVFYWFYKRVRKSGRYTRAS
jgi:tetratricopeptide (TPR) repeat protein